MAVTSAARYIHGKGTYIFRRWPPLLSHKLQICTSTVYSMKVKCIYERFIGPVRTQSSSEERKIDFHALF